MNFRLKRIAEAQNLRALLPKLADHPHRYTLPFVNYDSMGTETVQALEGISACLSCGRILRLQDFLLATLYPICFLFLYCGSINSFMVS